MLKNFTLSLFTIFICIFSSTQLFGQTGYAYSEDFGGCGNGTTTSPSADWSINTTGLAADGFTFSVQSNRFEAADLDGVGIWRSKVIDISCLSNVSINVALPSSTTMSNGN